MVKVFILPVGLMTAVAVPFSNCGSKAEATEVLHRQFYQPYQLQGYEVDATETTPLGIRLDRSGQMVDIEALDRQAREVEQCLNETLGDGQGHLDVSDVDWCGYGPPLTVPVDWSHIIVKIPDDWVMNCDGSQQLLKDQAPVEGCLEKLRKGQLDRPPSKECPCRWRVGIQNGETIIVTPSLYLLKDGLIKMITGCWDAWHDPRLGKCARPTVPPLPPD